MNEKEKTSANETEEIPEATAPPDELQPDVEDDPAVKDVPETTEQAIDPPSESQPREKKKHFMLLDFNILNPLLTRNENDCHIIAVDASDDDDDKDNDSELPPLVDKPPLGSATRPLLTFPPRSKDNYRNIRGISPPLFCTSSRPAPQPEIPDFLFQVIRQPQIKPEFDKFLMTAINQLQQKEKIDSSEELNKFVLNKEKKRKTQENHGPPRLQRRLHQRLRGRGLGRNQDKSETENSGNQNSSQQSGRGKQIIGTTFKSRRQNHHSTSCCQTSTRLQQPPHPGFDDKPWNDQNPWRPHEVNR